MPQILGVFLNEIYQHDLIDAAPYSTNNIYNTDGFSHAFFISENHFVLEGKGF